VVLIFVRDSGGRRLFYALHMALVNDVMDDLTLGSEVTYHFKLLFSY